mgnify:FL=1
MKSLSKIFYDILYNLDKKDFISFENNSYLINKYFYVKIENDRDKTTKLAKYLDEFQNFCFDLDINSVLNGSLNFKYR